ncbi:MAG: diguanylate cyclase domain-containing protein, partial [Spirochaetota bacterium]
MSKTHKSDAHQDAQNELIQELEQEIIYLRSLINAYENLTTYNDKEFRDIQSIIQAYEKLQEFQSREKADAETTIDAFKQITEMTAQELRDSRETISAYQHLSELHDREVMNAKETIDAMEQTSELSQSELKNFHDRFESLRRLGHPIQREMFAILDEDHENEQHLLMKLNLLNLRRNDRNFHSHLFNVLVNLDFEETEAKRYWDDILALNREVSEKLGRKVSFRVSMLDYFIDLNKHIRNPKIIEFKFFESAMNNAIFDKLTGLFNRTHLHIAMQSSIRNARRENSLVGIIMFDIDDFKRFNDFFGHPEGDTLLKSFGKILARTFTGTNTVFRYGGEEFLA